MYLNYERDELAVKLTSQFRFLPKSEDIVQLHDTFNSSTL